MNRPLLWALLALIFSLILTAANVSLWIIISFAVLIILLPFCFSKISFFHIIIVLSVYIIGIIAGIQTFQKQNIFSDYLNQPNEIIGIVNDLPVEKENSTSFVLKTLSINNENVSGKLQISVSHYETDYKTDFSIGDIIDFSGTIKQAEEVRNPGGFNYQLYLKSYDIDGIVYLDPYTSINVHSQMKGIKYYILSIRQFFENVIERNFSSKQADVIKGILFGEKNISEDIKTQFKNAGISHVIAVSGLHVGFIFLFIDWIFRLLRLKGRKKTIGLLFVLSFYLFLIGFPASAVRASVMLLIIVLSKEYHLSYDNLSAWCFAGIVILLFRPAQLFQAGFQLSFSATLSIILFYNPALHFIKKHIGKISKISENLILTLCALIGTIPAMLVHYHNINLLSIFSGIIIIPIIGLLFAITWFELPLLFLFPGINIFNFIPQTLAQLILDLSSLIGKIKGLVFYIGNTDLYFFPAIILFTFFITGYFCIKKSIHQLLLAGGFILCFIMIIIPLIIPKPLTITFLDVGQGDSALIQTPSGQAFLIDGGGYENINVNDQFKRKKISEKVLLPALYSMGISNLNGVFITHNHADHAQGIEELIQTIPIKQIFVSTKYNNDSLLNQNKIPVIQLGSGDTLNLEDDITIQVLWPDKLIEKSKEELQNHNGLVFQLCYRNNIILFTADIDESVENDLISTSDLKSDILKIAHHGSLFASSSEFLDKVDPKLAVISVGLNNLYGHPSEEILKRLKEHNIIVTRTDKMGAIKLICNGKIIKYSTYLGEE